MSLKIEYVPIDKIRPYEGNAKLHPARQIEQIKQSITDFGFNDPIAVWNNEIVEGHGRLLAAAELGIKKVPIIRLDELTDEQRRAYTLVHNKLTMNSGFDQELLAIELEKLPELDMEQFGLVMPDLSDDGYYGDERERTNKAYNLDLVSGSELTNDFWQMPQLLATDYIPDRLIGFNYAKTSKDKSAGIHFYVDDYQFERVWNYPEKYVAILAEYACILTPDFSLYMDMPMPMKIWNVYRSRQIGAYYQSLGMTVIPTLSWAEPETFEFCFRGIEENSVVSVSTVGVKSDSTDIWFAGMDEAVRQLHPSVVLEYGGDIGYDYGDIEVRRYSNAVLDNWKNIDSVKSRG